VGSGVSCCVTQDQEGGWDKKGGVDNFGSVLTVVERKGWDNFGCVSDVVSGSVWYNQPTPKKGVTK